MSETLPPDSVTIPLAQPIKVAGQEVTTLTVQEPRLKHYLLLDALRIKVTAAGELELANLGSLAKAACEQLAGLTPQEAGQIKIPDLIKIGGAVLGFFGLSLKTGATPWPSSPSASAGPESGK